MRLTRAGKMAKAGLAAVDIARSNGSWNVLDEVENLIVPADLQAAFKQHPQALLNYEALGRTARKAILHRLLMAKKEETRVLRIDQTINELLKP